MNPKKKRNISNPFNLNKIGFSLQNTCAFSFFPYFYSWEIEAEWKGKTDSRVLMWINSRFWAQKIRVIKNLELTCFSLQIPWFPSWLRHWQDEGNCWAANCKLQYGPTGYWQRFVTGRAQKNGQEICWHWRTIYLHYIDSL